MCARVGHVPYRGTSLIRNLHPPQDHHRGLGIFLLQGPTGRRFLMSEVPVYRNSAGTLLLPTTNPPHVQLAGSDHLMEN